MSKKEELTGIVGYISDEHARQLHSNIKKDGTTDVRFERGNDKILMRVKNYDIREVKAGESANGETRVHFILAPGSFIETVVKMFKDVKAIEDPTLTRLTAAANVSVSFV